MMDLEEFIFAMFQLLFMSFFACIIVYKLDQIKTILEMMRAEK